MWYLDLKSIEHHSISINNLLMLAMLIWGLRLMIALLY